MGAHLTGKRLARCRAVAVGALLLGACGGEIRADAREAVR